MLERSESKALGKKKNIIGLVAIAVLLLFTVLALFGVFSVTIWIVANIIVALAANIILKVLGRQRKL